ncbi:MAG: hypothetical protein IT537_10955 [Hyphomicrobiales bacterium]|nr:hypothetical protein [Hyphomicrobiales bacterium]
MQISRRWSAVVVACLLAVGAAQTAPSGPEQILIEYVAPKDPAHQVILAAAKDAHLLEKLQEFLAPFQLPRALTFKLEGCDGDANAFYDKDAITICYEYIGELWGFLPTQTTPAGVTRVDALIGPLLDTCLHEFGHAIFDMLGIPVLGREEDAADQLSAYLVLQLGKEEARRLIAGTAYAYKAEADAKSAPPTFQSFANEHGTPAQRFYNTLCIAYGADPATFGPIVTSGALPRERAEGCQDEYRQVAFAFERLIAPHIDSTLAQKVFARKWLPDPQRRVPRAQTPKP